MKSYYFSLILSLLGAAQFAYSPSSFGEELPKEARTEKKEAAIGDILSTYHQTPLERELETALKDSDECVRVYWSSLAPNEKGIGRTITCDIPNSDSTSKKKYIPLFGVNLDNLLSVRLKKNQPLDALKNYPTFGLSFLIKDEVIITTKNNDIYSLPLKDKDAERVYTILQKIIDAERSGEKTKEVKK